ncbi:Oidioi.mRNA.OKI2018_I69.XSR.g16305.t1.cds [Oikopleura dioica]|uniref:Oidioi.mRNA.OKI2018_I69.XSR.g16305.t1.cds n=1 Tax=Oikopleura dioica TaxID=34765 RepID=A0ABN7SFN6_OIKDI|nr:Oidioi.mRNA.OKI2018_I69.XSR.g16305.t1.cds [Oikopleura dioica]
MPFGCCFSAKNAIEPEETPRFSKKIEENLSTQSPLVSARSESTKVYSAVSKASKVSSKDSGCPQESVAGDVSDDESVTQIITEDFGDEMTRAQIENASRPETPDFCIAGRKVDETATKTVRMGKVLEQLEQERQIKEPKVTSTAFSYTIGDNSPVRLPSKLPPIQKKPIKNLEDIEKEKEAAAKRREEQFRLKREKTLMMEERRQIVLERKKTHADLSKMKDEEESSEQSSDEPVIERKIHDEDEIIPSLNEESS